MQHGKNYWDDRYTKNETQWDVGRITLPLQKYFDQLESRNISILIPGCGNAYEAEYLHEQGFSDVTLADISDIPLKDFSERCPTFPQEHLLQADFFDMQQRFDLIVEQTFFCALVPAYRQAYAEQCHRLLRPGGRLVGVLFDDQLFSDHPPYGGSKEEYVAYFEPYFDFYVFETCYNSIPPRADRELFINLIRK